MSTQPVNCGTSFCSCIECVAEDILREIIDDTEAQIRANPELVTPADESQLNRLDELLKENT